MSPRQRLAVLCVVTSTVAFTPPVAVAAGTVGPAQINAAVLPINVADAVLPIDLGGSVQPLEVQRTQGSTSVITVSADVLFAFDTATLTPPAIRTIANVARRIPHRPGITIHVDGYTDPIGTRGYNQSLSQRRAAAVVTTLKRAIGGAGARIVAAGHGPDDPVAPDTTTDGKDNPAGRAKNRRVTIGFPHA